MRSVLADGGWILCLLKKNVFGFGLDCRTIFKKQYQCTITSTNHNKSKQRHELIRICSSYLELVQSAGKIARTKRCICNRSRLAKFNSQNCYELLVIELHAFVSLFLDWRSDLLLLLQTSLSFSFTVTD